MDKKNVIILILIIVAGLFIGGIAIGFFQFDIFEKNPPVSEEKIEVSDDVDENQEELIENNQSEDENYYEIEVGEKAADFILRNLEGKEVRLSDYEGKIVLLNFWATTCPFCLEEMPDMQRLSDENDDLVVLAVDIMEDEKKVKDYIDQGGYDFEVVLDEKGDVSKTYLVGVLPTSYFINKEGILLGRVPGMMTWPQMNEILENIREEE